MAVVLKHVGCSVFVGVLRSTTFVFFRLKWSTILNNAKVAVTVCSRFLTVLNLVFLGFWSLHRISYGTEHISINSSLSFLRWEAGDTTFYSNANTSHWTSLVPGVFSLLQEPSHPIPLHYSTFYRLRILNIVQQWCSNSGGLFIRTTELCRVVYNIFECSVWNLSCHKSGVRNFEMFYRFEENLCSPVLQFGAERIFCGLIVQSVW